jgi:hypothetical protein
VIRLVINGKDADVLQTEKIIGEYAIAPIGDISKRVGARSISFKLPKTANNRSIFESSEQTTSQSVLPYRRIPCSLFVDGVNMNMSLCTLEKVDENYNVRVYGSNANFFDLLKDKKLEDLDLKHLNHHWDVSSLPLFQSTNSVLRYPLINWHYDAPNLALPSGLRYAWLGNLLPVVNENYLVEKIINEAGYTLDNQVLLTDLHQTRTPVIPLGSRKLTNPINLNKFIGDFHLNLFPTGSTSGLQYSAQTVVSQNERYWLTGFGQNSNFGGSFAFDCPVKVNFNLEFDLYNDGAPEVVRIDILASQPTGAPIVVNTITITVPTNPFPNAPIQYAFNRTIDLQYNFVGGLSQLSFVVRSIPSTNVYNLTLPQNRLKIVSVEKINQTGYNYNAERALIYTGTDPSIMTYCQPAFNLPNFTQSDFIKEYLKKFGSVMTVNDKDKKVTIIPFINIRNNIASAVNWSDKLDYTDELQTEFALDYSQRNNFKYAEDDTIIKPVNADYVLPVDNQNLEPEQDVITLKYTASPTNQQSYGVQIANIPLFKSFVIEKETKPKCLLMQRENSTFTFRRRTTLTAGQVTYAQHDRCYFIDSVSTVPNLGFGDNLFERYYLYLNDILDKVKLLEVKIRLSTNDVSNFDFLKPVYIRELDGYFYVNKIKFEYTAKKSSVVELVKLL